MQLCIDIGNTLIKYAIFEGRRLRFRDHTEGFDKTFLNGLIQRFQPRQAMVSSVRPLPASWISALRKSTDTLVLNHTVQLPIKLQYQTPETLGSDRIAVSVAAHMAFPRKDCLVINAGTCITLDLVTARGVYKGGAIAPGIEMRYAAMHQMTAKLPYVTHRKPVSLVGRNTEESMNAGVLNHVCYELEGAIGFYRKLYPELQVLITRGNVPFLAKRLKNGIFADPHLVLTGLNEILLYHA